MSRGAGLRSELKKRKLLKASSDSEETHLRALCHDGALVGGVSLSHRLTPEEAFGPLTWAMGGAARALKLLDVRGQWPMELHVRVGEQLEKREVDSIDGLIHNLNDLFKDDTTVARIVSLGEWEDMMQLWCLSARAVDELRAMRLLE